MVAPSYSWGKASVYSGLSFWGWGRPTFTRPKGWSKMFISTISSVSCTNSIGRRIWKMSQSIDWSVNGWILLGSLRFNFFAMTTENMTSVDGTDRWISSDCFKFTESVVCVATLLPPIFSTIDILPNLLPYGQDQWSIEVLFPVVMEKKLFDAADVIHQPIGPVSTSELCSYASSGPLESWSEYLPLNFMSRVPFWEIVQVEVIRLQMAYFDFPPFALLGSLSLGIRAVFSKPFFTPISALQFLFGGKCLKFIWWR